MEDIKSYEEVIEERAKKYLLELNEEEKEEYALKMIILEYKLEEIVDFVTNCRLDDKRSLINDEISSNGLFEGFKGTNIVDLENDLIFSLINDLKEDMQFDFE